MSEHIAGDLPALLELTGEMIDRWIALQAEWWHGLLLGYGGPAAVDAWRDAAHRVLDAQRELLNSWLERQHDIAEASRYGTAAEAAVNQWTDAQRRMWLNWLAASAGDPRVAEQREQAGSGIMAELEGAAEKLVHSQADWAARFSADRVGD